MNNKFKGRQLINDKCIPEDFISIGKPIPKRIDKYALTKCLNCGKILPTLKKDLNAKNYRCSFCMVQNDFVKVDDDISKIIVKSQNQVFEYLVDTDMLDVVSKYKWRIAKKRNKRYLITGTYKNKTAMYLHQMIYSNTVPVGYSIDHIDSNEYNNIRSNLRCITKKENAQNVNAKCTNKLGVRGIWYSKRNKSYGSSLTVNGVSYYFRYSKTVEEAIVIRWFAEQYFGLFIAERNPKVQKIIDKTPKKDLQMIKQYVYQTINQKKDNQYAERIC